MLPGSPEYEQLKACLESITGLTPKYIENLLSHGNLNSYQGDMPPPLVYALQTDNIGAIETLLALGADPNQVDDQNCPLLARAFLNNQIEAFKRLAESPLIVPLNLNKNSEGFIHLAAATGKLAIVAYLQGRADDLGLVTNNEESNALLIAAQHNQVEILQLLLKNPKYAATATYHDLYGRTALDYAIHHGNDQMITALLPEGLTLASIKADKSSGYNQPYLNLSQEHLNGKLIRYLQLQGRAAEKVIPLAGNCNGWAFLELVYASGEMIDELNQIKDFIATWDGELASLADELPPHLIDNLKTKYGSKTILLEHLINQLVLFHYKSDATAELNLPLEQTSRLEQYALIKDQTRDRHLVKVQELTLEGTKNIDQLVEYLEFFSRWPGAHIDVRCSDNTSGHATSLIISPEGHFQYYDSNAKAKIPPFTSARDLAAHIIKFDIGNLDHNLTDEALDIEFAMYKFYNKNETVPAIETPSEVALTPAAAPKISANKFNPLHFAVLENNLKEIAILVNEQPQLLSEKDAHGCTPIERALKIGHLQVLNALLTNGSYEANLNYLVLASEIAIDTQVLDLLLKPAAVVTKLRDPEYSVTYLHVIAKNTDQAHLAKLIQAGANINAVNPRDQSTALSRMLQNGTPAGIKLLLDLGANVGEKERNAAKRFQSPEIYRLIDQRYLQLQKEAADKAIQARLAREQRLMLAATIEREAKARAAAEQARIESERQAQIASEQALKAEQDKARPSPMTPAAKSQQTADIPKKSATMPKPDSILSRLFRRK